MSATIEKVTAADLSQMLILMREYCNFYEVNPPDLGLTQLMETLIAEPANGCQVIARTDEGEAVGFATVYWTWQTLSAERVGVMNDLFVVPQARGNGFAEALIDTCGGLCREQGVETLVWQTALDNARAQAVYDRVGGKAERWLDYSLDVQMPLGLQAPGD